MRGAAGAGREGKRCGVAAATATVEFERKRLSFLPQMDLEIALSQESSSIRGTPLGQFSGGWLKYGLALPSLGDAGFFRSVGSYVGWNALSQATLCG